MIKKLLFIISVSLLTLLFKELFDLYQLKEAVKEVQGREFYVRLRDNMERSYVETGNLKLRNSLIPAKLVKSKTNQIYCEMSDNKLSYYLRPSNSYLENWLYKLLIKSETVLPDDSNIYFLSTIEIGDKVLSENIIISENKGQIDTIKEEIDSIILSLQHVFETQNPGYYFYSEEAVLVLERNSVLGVINYSVNYKLDLNSEQYILQLKHVLIPIIEKYRISFIQLRILIPVYLGELLPPNRPPG